MLGLGSSLLKGGLVTPGIVTDSLVLKHNYAAGAVVPVSDGAASFDGTDDYINVADAANLSFVDGSGNDTAFSISVWVKMIDASGFAIVEKGLDSGGTEEYFLSVNGSDVLDFYVSDQSANAFEYTSVASAIITPLENQWIHIAATYNGVGGASANAGQNIYINGVLQTVTRADQGTYVDMENLGGALTIGKQASAYAEGYICNLGLWSVALTQAQIKSIMWKNYAGLDSSETTNLVSWWNLSADANDNHGSNNGTLS